MTERGRHTVLLGMAPGVGKTYRALQDLRRARDAGRDAVVALVETHGRAETAAQVEGLEVLPRRTIEHRGIVQHELDLPALLERGERGAAGPASVVAGGSPAGEGRLLVLVDELAHTNAPGTEHPKRWQDVEAALQAGIDVVSTVNVQHLESLNDQVMELTGVRVRETVPDGVLVAAEDVVVIDLPPDALLQRLRDGQIYPMERVPAALNNFFRVEGLTALRETALLQAAEEVGARRLSARPTRVREDRARPARPGDVGGRGATGAFAARGEHGDGPRMGEEVVDAVRERMLVLVSANGSGQRVLRRAWRSARRLKAEVDVLHVRRPGRPPAGLQAERLEGLRSLCGILGAELLEVEDDDVDVAAARVARERGTTYVFVGVPRPPQGLGRVAAWLPPAITGAKQPLPVLLWRRLPGVDVRVVSDRGDRSERRTP